MSSRLICKEAKKSASDSLHLSCPAYNQPVSAQAGGLGLHFVAKDALADLGVAD